jgi:hypothetical protein
MSPPWPHGVVTTPSTLNKDIDDAEKGQYTRTETMFVSLPGAPSDEKAYSPQVEHVASPLSPASSLFPISPIHEGLTPLSSNPGSSLSLEKLANPPSEKRAQDSAPVDTKSVTTSAPKVSRWILFRLWLNTYRKFFLLVTALNLAGIILACLDRFPYATSHSGALVLGNLLMAVLMRNELFLRFLYTVAIYGLRSVSLLLVNGKRCRGILD